ncbi:MAG TPA: pilus assembly protein PilP [Rudaea sp.]|nr:pilus assembly protein PilP [Rudaea sp.]
MRIVHLPLARALALGAAFAFLAGCSDGDSDLREWIAREKAKKGTPIPPLPVLKTFETFEYKDQEKRDPFAPSLEEQQQERANANAGAQIEKHPKEPLENFPLDSLKMVGTIGTGGTMEGLIKDPDNVIHRVHLHNYLGQNNGKITAIAEDHIDLVELIPNGTGGWMERQASVALGEK